MSGAWVFNDVKIDEGTGRMTTTGLIYTDQVLAIAVSLGNELKLLESHLCPYGQVLSYINPGLSKDRHCTDCPSMTYSVEMNQ